jgi:hypothetical protein
MAVDIDKQTMFIILHKIRENLEETGHIMHHKVGDGSCTIVDTDVTLEHMLKQINPLPCVPVNRAHYGFDLYSNKGDK